MTLVRGLVAGAILLTVAACGGGGSAKAVATTTPTTPPVQAAVVHVEFADSQFTASTCPKAHLLANCFSGTGTATLPRLGLVSISRTVISGDQKRTAPSGCDPADTTGVLKDGQGGTARISGTGTLCGQLAKYTLMVDQGTGSLANLTIAGSITNNGGVESWDVVSLRH